MFKETKWRFFIGSTELLPVTNAFLNANNLYCNDIDGSSMREALCIYCTVPVAQKLADANRNDAMAACNLILNKD